MRCVYYLLSEVIAHLPQKERVDYKGGKEGGGFGNLENGTEQESIVLKHGIKGETGVRRIRIKEDTVVYQRVRVYLKRKKRDGSVGKRLLFKKRKCGVPKKRDEDAVRTTTLKQEIAGLGNEETKNTAFRRSPVDRGIFWPLAPPLSIAFDKNPFTAPSLVVHGGQHDTRNATIVYVL